mmetsp:Transcript_20724/g.26163  ORF Transcript_20724/g.26163 Transcript_20724/m.26163 type:complete len:325 (-) Transcript_20724:372-1346(-)
MFAKYILYPFFFSWNLGIAFVLVHIITTLCRWGPWGEGKRWTDAIVIVIISIPFAFIGIAVPIAQYPFFSNVEFYIFIAVSVVFPYLFWAIRINGPTRWGGGETFRDIRETLCFSCFCRNNGRGNEVQDGHDDGHDDEHQQYGEDEERQTQREDEDEDKEHHLEDTRIICKKVVQGNGKRHSHERNWSFRSKHPKSDIAVNRSKKSSTEDNGSTGRSDIQKKPLRRITETGGQKISYGKTSFPILSPIDIESVNTEELHPRDEENVQGGISDSIQICNICLEEYKVGEDIGWSRNSDCHHAFHKDCIIEWLANNDDCPICREKY